MSVFEHPEFDAHEQVLFVTDPRIGLFGIIALHSTALGAAAGGCRMHPYQSTDDALTDVLRLSKGMSYKNAVAGLPLGGGKSVIVAEPNRPDKHRLLKKFAEHVQSLSGRYWAAIDVGVGPEDADVMAEHCDYIFARASQYEKGFNPSSFTALGGYIGIKAVVAHIWGERSLNGMRFAIQGLGATGADLAKKLHDEGAELVVADVQEDRVKDMVDKYGAEPVPPEKIHSARVDVFVPCALGAILNDQTIPDIKAKAICGLANNQLASDYHGNALLKRNITYVPDYVVNAGGMIGASTIIFDVPDRQQSENKIRNLYDSISSILKAAESENLSTVDVANRIAIDRINSAQRNA